MEMRMRILPNGLLPLSEHQLQIDGTQKLEKGYRWITYERSNRRLV